MHWIHGMTSNCPVFHTQVCIWFFFCQNKKILTNFKPISRQKMLLVVHLATEYSSKHYSRATFVCLDKKNQYKICKTVWKPFQCRLFHQTKPMSLCSQTWLVIHWFISCSKLVPDLYSLLQWLKVLEQHGRGAVLPQEHGNSLGSRISYISFVEINFKLDTNRACAFPTCSPTAGDTDSIFESGWNSIYRKLVSIPFDRICL